MNKLKRHPAAAFMLAFLVAGILLALASFWTGRTTLRPLGQSSTGDFLRGKAAGEFEKLYNKVLVGRDGFIALWGSINYGAMRTGSKGVVTGRDGWLFTEEEFTPSGEKARASYTKNLETILSVRERLAAQGIKLAVILLPAKARVNAEMLYAPMPAECEVLYQETLSTLQKENIPAVDGFAVLNQMKQEGGLPFMRTDTHWSPQGAKAVASATAALVQTLGLQLPQQEFTLVPGTAESFIGDLGSFVPTGILQPVIGPAEEPLERFSAEKASAEGASLFGDEQVDVTLIGTSYSAIDKWNFEGALRAALHTDIVNLADPGTGPFTPMHKFLENTAIQKPKLVLWEIPERFLKMDYSGEKK